MRDESGLALLYTVLLLPMVLVLIALVLEVGALRVHRARLQSAADIAAAAAVTEQDRDALAVDGTYRIAREGVDVARAALADGIRPMTSALAPGTSAEAIAGAAEIVIVEPGSFEAATGRRHDAPTVRIRFRAAVRTPLLLLAWLRDTTTLTIVSAASAR